MSEYITDIARYVDAVDEEAVAGIVKHLGIALRSNKDASLVSASDQSEFDRVRESWLERKLNLDGDLDASIAAVREQMAGDRQKQRVTFYCLLAGRHGKLAELH